MSIKNILATSTGFVLLGLGAVGAFIPILPTTPFVLAASVCFAGNPKIKSWLLKNKFFQEHLTNYEKRTGLKKSTVLVSLGCLWAMLGWSMIRVEQMRILFLVVGIAVTIHILLISHPKRKIPQENSNKF